MVDTKAPLEYNSFMGVINATLQGSKGVYIPGDLMPSGRPVTAEGVDLNLLRNNKDMATQWFEAVKGAYEREEEEANRSTGPREAPGASPVGSDTAPRERGGNAKAAEDPPKTLEEELQARLERVEEKEAEAEKQVAVYTKAAREARKECTKLRKALKAIGELPSQSSSNDGPPASGKSEQSTANSQQ